MVHVWFTQQPWKSRSHSKLQEVHRIMIAEEQSTRYTYQDLSELGSKSHVFHIQHLKFFSSFSSLHLSLPNSILTLFRQSKSSLLSSTTKIPTQAPFFKANLDPPKQLSSSAFISTPNTHLKRKALALPSRRHNVFGCASLVPSNAASSRECRRSYYARWDPPLWADAGKYSLSSSSCKVP